MHATRMQSPQVFQTPELHTFGFLNGEIDENVQVRSKESWEEILHVNKQGRDLAASDIFTLFR